MGNGAGPKDSDRTPKGAVKQTSAASTQKEQTIPEKQRVGAETDETDRQANRFSLLSDSASGVEETFHEFRTA